MKWVNAGGTIYRVVVKQYLANGCIGPVAVLELGLIFRKGLIKSSGTLLDLYVSFWFILRLLKMEWFGSSYALAPSWAGSAGGWAGPVPQYS